MLNAAFTAVLQAIGLGIGLVIFSITQLPVLVLGTLAALPSLLDGFFTRVWVNISALALAGVGSVVGFISSLPLQAMAALAALPAVLDGFFTNLWARALQIVVTGALTVVGFIGSIRQLSLAQDLLARRVSLTGSRTIP
jgi:hypothetical protein